MYPELVGVHEIAEMANVRSSAVSNWRVRHADFPTPLVELASGPIFIRTDVERWLENRSCIH